ncbi:hypothetical protein BASA84_000409 [Batrachochytrium salamandrivorans]|nr:hypothetical protein BASA84_000409 [Batrachochytrium salamandrivorans]
MSLAERKAYILMDVIRPPLFKNTLVRNGISVTTDVVSELGVYGAYLSDGSTVHMNTIVGHLLRTKMSDSDEGGVAAGFAVWIVRFCNKRDDRCFPSGTKAGVNGLSSLSRDMCEPVFCIKTIPGMYNVSESNTEPDQIAHGAILRCRFGSSH